MSDTLQYTIVGIIILAAIIWAGIKAAHIGKGKKSSSCCGCALSDACAKKDTLRKTDKCEDKKDS